MDRQDFATSRVKKKRMKRHPSNLDLTLRVHFVGFNISRYNSLDQRLRLNHFKNDLPMNKNVPRSESPNKVVV